MPFLRTVRLSKSFERRGEKFYATNNVNLIVERNDFVCVTGQSGSGKSTLLNMLVGLIRADSGEILLDGEDVCLLHDNELARLRNTQIGYIPQGNSLLQNFSVLDNVCLPWYLTRNDDICQEAWKIDPASASKNDPP
jgi:putative ABC transport system ATP-binding protein